MVDFGELNTEKNINNLSNKNTILEINKNNSDPSNTINLDNIKISKPKETSNKQNRINFDISNETKIEKKHYRINYRKIFIISFSIIVFSSVVSLSLYHYNQYIIGYSKQIETEPKFINKIDNIKQFLNIYLGINTKHGSNEHYDIIGENGVNTLNEILKSNNSYIQKKNILKKSTEDLSNNILSSHKNLDNIKMAITKEAFFPKNISEIISDQEQISSIHNSLLSLESIKFSSAINVFPYLETFLDGLSKTTNLEKGKINIKNKEILDRGDKDINLYLKNCYLNPFENSYECDMIGDFERYYILVGDNKFDNIFFRQLIKYIDVKLEQTELPSFSIDFKKFDKNSNKITFNININTFKEDEIELAKKGIFSPHIFILNNLINNLKQNRFILGKGINVKTLKVEQKIIDLGATEFHINNSNKTFTVDIQKEVEREIYDFINTEN